MQSHCVRSSPRGYFSYKYYAFNRQITFVNQQVKFDQYDITVDYKRMLTENIVEVGLLSSLFRAILKCKIRDVGPFQTCCKANMLAGCGRCGVNKPVPWIKFCRKLANGLLILFIPTPYYVRLLVFYLCENEEIMARKAVIELNGLKERYENSLIHYFTPTHPLFLIIYMIYAMTAFMLAFMSRKQNEGWSKICYTSLLFSATIIIIIDL